MYYGQRDKIISVRVSSELLAEAQKIIDSYTKVYGGLGGRRLYESSVPGFDIVFAKVSVADLFEKALKDFVANTPVKPELK